MSGPRAIAAPVGEWQSRGDVAAISPRDIERDAPDAHLIGTRDGRLVARCSCWWRNALSYAGRRCGLIGHYAAADEETGREVLAQACAALADAGCALALGPVDGTSWRPYRFIVDQGVEPAFFLEPRHPTAFPAHWLAAGFTVRERHHSCLVTDLRWTDPRVERAADRIRADGVRLRPFDPEHADRDLRSIFELSRQAFVASPLAVPIAWAEFRARHEPILDRLEPRLVLMAEAGDRLQGFLFATPDWCQAQRGADVDRIVIKTLAVRPGRETRGLGSVLVAEAHARAKALGYRRAIHALMRDDNVSANISRRYGRPIRRYALFGRPLDARRGALP